jgi:hypothetical protein
MKLAAQIHNEIIDRTLNQKDEIDQLQKDGMKVSDYSIGWYDALCDLLVWLEEDLT